MSDQSQAITIVIFGASGDLTSRKLMPALFNLCRKHRLPGDHRIVGFARTDWSDDAFRQEMRKAVDQFAEYKFTDQEWQEFSTRLFYVSGNYDDHDSFGHLTDKLHQVEQEPANRLYYLAIPPQFFTEVVDKLSAAGLANKDTGWRRVVIEKPFGSDLASAKALNDELHKYLQEDQIYRIDHYLGKETVQNLLTFRFANAVFQPIWDSQHIDSVQITVAEKVGVEHRAGYYEKAGVVRDMFQNHLLQLMTLIAMEPPKSPGADPLREEKVKVLKAIRPIPPGLVAKETVRGQYRGYRQEPDVAPDSQTATFAAMRLFIDNPRWQGVSFYLRSGKKLADKCSEIIIHFKCPELPMFTLPEDYDIQPNMLAFLIQPDEGIHLRFDAKVPDATADVEPVDMEFHYRDTFGPQSIPEAYERLLLDAIHGDQSLFVRADQTELAWELIDPILAAWQSPDAPALETYVPGSWGPQAAEALIQRDHNEWVRACGEHKQA